jgi:hypothetical protein
MECSFGKCFSSLRASSRRVRQRVVKHCGWWWHYSCLDIEKVVSVRCRIQAAFMHACSCSEISYSADCPSPSSCMQRPRLARERRSFVSRIVGKFVRLRSFRYMWRKLSLLLQSRRICRSLWRNLHIVICTVQQQCRSFKVLELEHLLGVFPECSQWEVLWRRWIWATWHWGKCCYVQ